MKKLIFFILVLSSACAAPKKETPAINYDSLTNFFMMCEKDINNARQVILDNDLIKNLSHLHFMDHGGKKYYVLERESITEMIKAVTTGIYSDFILINKSGVVIYTMKNDDIFSKNVLSSLKTTPLNRCYENRDRSLNIEDMSEINLDSGEKSIFISIKVKGGDTFPGIFILQVDRSKIIPLLDNNEVIGTDGNYKISKKQINEGKPFSGFELINFESQGNRIRANNFSYRIFRYSNLSWALVRE